jgi:hypothetical protein
MRDFVGNEILGSREYAELANRLYRLGDGLRTKLLSDLIKVTRSNTPLIFFFSRCFISNSHGWPLP